MAGPIGTLGTIPTLTVAGRVFTDLTNLLILANYTSTNQRATFRLPGASSGRAVTASTTLRIYAATTNGFGLAGDFAINLAQTDNDVGLDSATAFTNPNYYGGGSSNTFGAIKAGNFVNQNEFIVSPGFTVAATKYISSHIFSAASVVTHIFGYET